MQDLADRIDDRLKELRAEMERLEKAKDALMNGRVSGGRRGRRAATAKQVGDKRKRRRRRGQRMDLRERQGQVLHAIREAGGDGISISDLAKKVAVSRTYLAAKILPPLNAQVIRSRGRVAAKT
jgi:ribosome-binding protein aMBF1 (putative translation factor)